MDLNKAMTDMYKRRSSAMKRQSPKTLPANSEKKTKVEDSSSSQGLVPQISFDQLYGCDEARDQILESVERFQRHLDGTATKPRLPVLIRGSKGLGKTSLVEAAAQKFKLRLVRIPLDDLEGKSRKEFRVILNHLLKLSISNQPSLVLVDDLDKLNEKEDLRVSIKVAMKQLLSDEYKIMIFTTASKPLVDESIFSETIELKRPSQESRCKILKKLVERISTDISEDNLKELAFSTPSFTPSDLFKMVECAQNRSKGCVTTNEHFIKATTMVKKSFTRNGTYLIGERPTVTWNDIGGLPQVRHKFINIMERLRTGGMSCKFAGFVLYGPPGCGKTLVAKAMANEAGLNFISIKPGELLNKYHGETENNIIRVFREAREYEPCMIYFDEFDGLCGARENRNHVTNAINTFLAEMDGLRERGDSIVLASTNRIQDIDSAMKRPGRLSEHIYVGPPDEDGRKDILKVLTKSISLNSDVSLDHWAKRTDRFTGADMDYLVQSAKYEASKEACNPTVIRRSHLELALRKICDSNKGIGQAVSDIQEI